MKINITIPLPPVTKKNSQQIVRTKAGRWMVIPSKQYTKYEKSCKAYLRPHGINYPVNVEALYYMPTKRRVDLCNLHEALCDVLVKHGVIEDDNSRIIVSMDGSRVLYDREFPRTEVLISEVETPNR